MTSTASSPSVLRLAIDTVAEACRVANAVQKNLDRVRQITKDDRSPVTVADFAVQAIVRLGLGLHIEQPPIIGEEHAAALRDPEQAAVLEAVVEAVQAYREHITADEVLAAIDACDHDATADAFWALDPVDGTKGFLRGQQYAVALARIEHGQVVLAVMGCPNLPRDQNAPLEKADKIGAIYVASRDGGAWELPADQPRIEPARIRASSGGDGPLRICESVEKSHSKQSDTQRILDVLGEEGGQERGAGEDGGHKGRREPRPPRAGGSRRPDHTLLRLDSQAKYAVVARGQADAYLRLPTTPGGRGYVEKIWDHAAGMLIATEAGARVTDIAGTELDFSKGRRLEANRGIICAAPHVHGRIIDAIDRLGIAAPA